MPVHSCAAHYSTLHTLYLWWSYLFNSFLEIRREGLIFLSFLCFLFTKTNWHEERHYVRHFCSQHTLRFRQLHETCNASPPIPFLQSYLNLRILHPIRFSIGVLLLTMSCIRRHVTCEFANNCHLLKYLHKHILKPYRKHMNNDISLQV